MPIELLRLPDVMVRTTMGRRAIYRQMKHPVRPFPKPARLGLYSVWRADEIDQWIEQRFAERKAS